MLFSLQTKMTDEEKLKLYEELVRCRRALSDSRLLRPAEGVNKGFLRQSIRRCVYCSHLQGGGGLCLTVDRLGQPRVSTRASLGSLSEGAYTAVIYSGGGGGRGGLSDSRLLRPAEGVNKGFLRQSIRRCVYCIHLQWGGGGLCLIVDYLGQLRMSTKASLGSLSEGVYTAVIYSGGGGGSVW